MPALFALAMHQALVALQPELRPEERSLAFLDDLYLTAQPDRIQPLFQAASRCLYERARISLNHARTRVWNAAAVEPPGLADITAADVWRGNAQLPEAEQGITVLGAPLGGNAFVRAQLDAVRNKQLRLLQVLPTLPDLQVAWLLLLYCASPRSNYALRIIPPELTDLFAIGHDAAVQRCFSAMLFGEDGGALPDTASRQSQLAFRHGGLGLRSARLHAPAAFWASWADSLSAIQRRDPDLAQHIVRQLEPDVPCCRVLDTLKATVTLLARQGFEAPQWHQLLGDDAPQPHDVEDDAPGIGRGWQKAASAALDLQSAAAHSDNLDAASAAMLLSQSGPCSAQVFLMLPVCPELILEPSHFRVLLLRRLRLPLPFVPARCRCGREQDALGDHRSACPRSGVLRARGGPLERAVVKQGPWLLCTHWSGTSMSAACPQMTGGLKS